MTERDTQRARAGTLNLHGLLAHWSEVADEAWVSTLLGWEEHERARRSHGGGAPLEAEAFKAACPQLIEKRAPRGLGIERPRLDGRHRDPDGRKTWKARAVGA